MINTSYYLFFIFFLFCIFYAIAYFFALLESKRGERQEKMREREWSHELLLDLRGFLIYALFLLIPTLFGFVFISNLRDEKIFFAVLLLFIAVVIFILIKRLQRRLE